MTILYKEHRSQSTRSESSYYARTHPASQLRKELAGRHNRQLFAGWESLFAFYNYIIPSRDEGQLTQDEDKENKTPRLSQDLLEKAASPGNLFT